MLQKHIDKAKDIIKNTKFLAIMTGAGISAESDIPTFRGEDGLWKNYRAEELATPEAFNRNPEIVWEWYNWRRDIIGSKNPNPAHYACVNLENRYNDNFSIITQNVDGLHKKAGSIRVCEIHGNIWEVRCLECGSVYYEEEKLDDKPKCKKCLTGFLRPNVVWFGESLDPKVLSKTDEVLNSCDTLLIIGTSGIVYPAAAFYQIAKSNGAKVIEINPATTPSQSSFDCVIKGKAGEVLPLIV